MEKEEVRTELQYMQKTCFSETVLLKVVQNDANLALGVEIHMDFRSLFKLFLVLQVRNIPHQIHLLAVKHFTFFSPNIFNKRVN